MDQIRVFISYSHDSDDHRKAVASLAAQLRNVDGLDVMIDQYVNGSPVEGWPEWMLNQLDVAKYVLVVCTETYHRRFRGKEARGRGRGVTWEGAIIKQAIYDAYCQTLKFVPILFSPDQEPFIPEPLRSYTHYNPTTTNGYQDLYDFLLEQKGLDPGDIGTLKRKARPIAEPLALIGSPKPSSRPLDNLPYHSLGPLFKGREPVLQQLRKSLTIPTITPRPSSAWPFMVWEVSARRGWRLSMPGVMKTITRACSLSSPIRLRLCGGTLPHYCQFAEYLYRLRGIFCWKGLGFQGEGGDATTSGGIMGG